MNTQDGYQGSRREVVGATEFENYRYGKGAYPTELVPFRSLLITHKRREELTSGAVAEWPGAWEGIDSATQGTAANQPLAKSGNINRSAMVSFAGDDWVDEPASVYNQFSGAGGLANHTLIVRHRPLDWNNRELYGIVSVPSGYNHRMLVATPAYQMQSPIENVVSEATDYTQTDRYVAMIVDTVGQVASIVERGYRVSESWSIPGANQVASSAQIGAVAGLLPFIGQIDEVIIIAKALSDEEVKSILPYLFRDHYVQFCWFGNSLLASGTPCFLAQARDLMPRGVGTVAGWQRGGYTTTQLLAKLRERLSGQVIPGVTKAVFWEATNSIFFGTTFDDLVSLHEQAKSFCDSLGVELIGGTCLPRASFNATQEALRVRWNVEIKANWQRYVSKSAYVVDYAAVPQLQNPNNLTYYSDGIHWTALGAKYGASRFYNQVVGTVL